MPDFLTQINEYATKSKFTLGNFEKNESVNFLRNGILTVFDGNKNLQSPARQNLHDGKIDQNEFNAVTKEQYEKYTKDIELAYKQKFRRDLEYHIPTYEELSYMLENEAQGNKKIITAQEITEPIAADGKIGQTRQAGSGDCTEEATGLSMSLSNKGENLLKRSIKCENGKYKVTLYGAQKYDKKQPVTYTFTQKQLKDSQELFVYDKQTKQNIKKYPYGDADMVLLDMAIEQYRKDSNHKLYFKNTAAVKGYDDYLSTGAFSEQFSLITGCETKQEKLLYKRILNQAASSNTEIKNKARAEATLYNNKTKQQKVLQLLRDYKGKDQFAGATFLCTDNNWEEFKKYGLYEQHQFFLKDFDEKTNTVVLGNSHYGKYTDVKLPLDIFTKYVIEFDHS